MKDKKKLIGDIVFFIFVIAIIIFSIFFARSDDNDKSIFGYRFYNVLTPSMEPTIKVGSMVFVKLVDTNELKEEDIIAYSASIDGKIVVTHRINKIKNIDGKVSFITKGDANQVVDINPVVSSQIIGKVYFVIPYLGSAMEYIRNNILIVIMAIVSLIIIFELISKIASKNKK